MLLQKDSECFARISRVACVAGYKASSQNASAFPRSRSRYLSAPTMVCTTDWSAHSHHHHSIFRNAAFPQAKAPLRPHSWRKDSSNEPSCSCTELPGHSLPPANQARTVPRCCSLSALDTRASCPLPLLHDLEANARNVTNLRQRTEHAKPLIVVEPLALLGHQLRDLVVRSQKPTLHRSHQ